MGYEMFLKTEDCFASWRPAANDPWFLAVANMNDLFTVAQVLFCSSYSIDGLFISIMEGVDTISSFERAS